MSDKILEEGSSNRRRKEMTAEIQEMNDLWTRTALLSPLLSLRTHLALIDPLSPALILNPKEFELFAYYSGDTRVILLSDVLRIAHPQQSFWEGSDNNEQLLFKCIWLCKYYEIEEDAALVRGDCSPEKSLEFWEQLAIKIIQLREIPGGGIGTKETEVDSEDWSITPNDGDHDWTEFISLAFTKVFDTTGSSLPASRNDQKTTRMKFTLKDVMALDHLNTIGVLEHTNIAKLTTGMNRIAEQVGDPEDYIEERDQKQARNVLEKLNSVKESVEKMLKIWEENDFFQETKTAFMVAYASSMVKVFDKIQETQRAFMVAVVGLLDRKKDKDNKNSADSEPAVRFIDKPGSSLFMIE